MTGRQKIHAEMLSRPETRFEARRETIQIGFRQVINSARRSSAAAGFESAAKLRGAHRAIGGYAYTHRKSARSFWRQDCKRGVAAAFREVIGQDTHGASGPGLVRQHDNSRLVTAASCRAARLHHVLFVACMKLRTGLGLLDKARRVAERCHQLGQLSGMAVQIFDRFSVGVVVEADSEFLQGRCGPPVQAGLERHCSCWFGEVVSKCRYHGPGSVSTADMPVYQDAGTHVGRLVDVSLEERMPGQRAGMVVVEIAHRYSGFEQPEEIFPILME